MVKIYSLAVEHCTGRHSLDCSYSATKMVCLIGDGCWHLNWCSVVHLYLLVKQYPTIAYTATKIPNSVEPR